MVSCRSQESGQVVWYSHLSKNFPQFVVTHTVKGSGVVNKAKVDVFLELSCFFDDPAAEGNHGQLILPPPSPFTEHSFEYLLWVLCCNSPPRPFYTWIWSRSPALQADSLPTEPPGKPWTMWRIKYFAQGHKTSKGRTRFWLQSSCLFYFVILISWVRFFFLSNSVLSVLV